MNRAGIPLMELVFEPDLADGEEAAALVKELMVILNRLGTCSCKMEGRYCKLALFPQFSLSYSNCSEIRLQ